MPRIPKQVFHYVLMEDWAEEIGREAARAKAMSELAGGAMPPWDPPTGTERSS